jgi:hypothetical protein
MLNHITKIKTYLTFCGGPLKQPLQKMGRQYFVTATDMSQYQKLQYWCRPT